MGNVSIKKTIRYLIITAMILIFVTSMYGLFVSMSNLENKVDYRQVRIDLNSFTEQVEEHLQENKMTSIGDDLTTPMIQKGMKGIIVDLSGKVVFKFGNPEYQTGQKFALKQLSGTMNDAVFSQSFQYSTPILVNGVQQYTIVIDVDKTFYSGKNIWVYGKMIPIVAAEIFMFILLLWIYHNCKKMVFIPIENLHQIITNMLHGNLEVPLVYDYDDEVGTLCRDVELMRSELLISSHQAKQLKDQEKLLLACISHDLKTPLFGISSYVEGIRDHIVKDEEGISRYTNIILNKVQVMEKLIGDIIEHSEAELDEMTIRMCEVYANSYFTGLFKEVKEDVIKSGRTFQIGSIPEYIINIDEQRIGQVIYNIVSNAMKYSEEGSIIRVGFSEFNTGEKNELVISIQDTGKGIASYDLPFIFDKFYRGERARTQNIPGSGLGLNIAKYIIEKHGGRIECDSVLGRGTVIQFSLPL